MRIHLIFAVLVLTATHLGAQATPLTRAIRLEHFEEARRHITPELVNQPDRGGYHPLAYAVYAGDKRLIEALLEAGADPDAVASNAKTALYVAANLADVEAMKLLHRHGAIRPPFGGMVQAFEK
jgi:ankyrin repeat protein